MKKMEQGLIYFLKGKRYYVGNTGKLENILKEHKEGTTKSMREIGDLELVKFIYYENKIEAIKL